MPIKTYRPTTQTLRYRTTLVNDDITTKYPHKPLVEPKQRTGGRRNSGDITMRFIGGGHKRKLRIIDFKRDKTGIPGDCDDDRIRSQPLVAHCAAGVCRWREALHPSAGRAEGWAEDFQWSGCRHSGGQCAAAAEYSARHDRFIILS